MAQIARFNGVDVARLCMELPVAIASYLDDQPVTPAPSCRTRPSGSRLRPDLRLTQLFDEWKVTLQPSQQSAHEYKQSMLDFVEMFGDVPATEITSEDLLDYRDAAAKLPRAMPRADRALPSAASRGTGGFGVADDERGDAQERIGAIQALLAFAFKRESWIQANVGTGIVIEGYSKNAGAQAQQPRQERSSGVCWLRRSSLHPQRGGRIGRCGIRPCTGSSCSR
ncbi:hypothetical protein AB5I41_14125 [Sphingomonas sp. MMS24-JH45]